MLSWKFSLGNEYKWARVEPSCRCSLLISLLNGNGGKERKEKKIFVFVFQLLDKSGLKKKIIIRKNISIKERVS